MIEAVRGSKKACSAAVDIKKKLKIEYIDDETIPAVNEFQGCSLCNSKLMQRWAKLAKVDIKSQGRKLTIADIDKNGGNFVDYDHVHKDSIPKLFDNDLYDEYTSAADEEEVGTGLATLLQNDPRNPHEKGDEMIIESKSRLRLLMKETLHNL